MDKKKYKKDYEEKADAVKPKNGFYIVEFNPCNKNTPRLKLKVNIETQKFEVLKSNNIGNPAIANATYVSAQKFTSILMVDPSMRHYKKILGSKDNLVYIEIGSQQNGEWKKEIYCTTKKDLPKYVLVFCQWDNVG